MAKCLESPKYVSNRTLLLLEHMVGCVKCLLPSAIARDILVCCEWSGIYWGALCFYNETLGKEWTYSLIFSSVIMLWCLLMLKFSKGKLPLKNIVSIIQLNYDFKVWQIIKTEEKSWSPFWVLDRVGVSWMMSINTVEWFLIKSCLYV